MKVESPQIVLDEPDDHPRPEIPLTTTEDSTVKPVPLDDEEDGPLLSGDLTLDPDRASELSILPRTRSPARRGPKARNQAAAVTPSSQADLDTLLARGKLLKYRCTARLGTSLFGRYLGSPAALILLSLCFHDSGSSKFRWARITVDICPSSNDESLKIVRFAPQKRMGPPVDRAYKLSAGVSTALVANQLSFGASMRYSTTRSWEMLGSEDGDSPVRRIEWTLTENKNDPSGLPEAPKVAVIVTGSGEGGFRMRVGMAATTKSGIPIRCNGKEGMGMVEFGWAGVESEMARREMGRGMEVRGGKYDEDVMELFGWFEREIEGMPEQPRNDSGCDVTVMGVGE